MKRNRTAYLLPVLIILVMVLAGWGKTGHFIISKNSVLSFPPQMKEFLYWGDILASHASDADNRKSYTPGESEKHYIDIDSYPEFVANGNISQNYDSVVAKHGSSFVIDNGILPWAIIAAYDSLKARFSRRDFDGAALIAADLGHYVADSHQPLHITQNYNPGGLHSRYESTMVDKYQDQIQYGGDSVQFIQNVPDFVFSYIYKNYAYVDSLITADDSAKAFNSDTRSAAYLQKLWDLTGNFTIALFDSASNRLASLIYTAWVNAGRPLPSAASVETGNNSVNTFILEQNYPNPFNPSTVISYQLAAESRVQLRVYDILGRAIVTLVDEEQPAGKHQTKLDAANLSGGIYICTLRAGRYSASRKMILLK